MLGDNGGRVEGVLLGKLGLDLSDDGAQVADILQTKNYQLNWLHGQRGEGGMGRVGKTYSLVGGPVGTREQLVLVAALRGTADAVDALVGLLVGEALEGDLNNLALLLPKVIVPAFGKVSAWLWSLAFPTQLNAATAP